MNIVDDIPKYKKKSQKTPPKKSKHKHVYETCIIEVPCEWWNKPHARSGKTRSHFYSYCPICGKVGEQNPGSERWWVEKKHSKYAGFYYPIAPTPEGERELNPVTRTLPTFYSDDIFPKFVDLEDT